MTVDELYNSLKALKKSNPGCGRYKVILSSDAEGNGYSPLSEVSKGKYIEENTWSGEVVHPDDVEDYDKDELEEVLVLWPVN